MNLKQYFVLIILFTLSFSLTSQEKFLLPNNLKKNTVSFQLINNLIVIPVDINGTELLFLLDTGVDKTILFNLETNNSLRLLRMEKIKLQGLGEGSAIEAIKSRNNTLRIDKVIGKGQMIYILKDAQFELSAKMGVDVNGIIGGDLFDDFIVKINYALKKITFYDPEFYEYKKCRSCLTFPLEFYKRKPLLKVEVENHLNEKFDVKLLLDSGGSDAIWLFENSHPSIVVPKNHFADLLGQGLGGNIYGERSKINKLNIGSFHFENVSVSYPDSTSVLSVQNNKNRNGTIGSEILRRFHIIYDYPNNKITLKKNGDYKDIFTYNKSGIELVYGGDMLVSERRPVFSNSNSNNQSENSITEIIYTYSLAYKPSFQISFIREGSSAKNAGLKVGDILLEINGTTAYIHSLEEIIYFLSGKENKKIRLKVDRDGKHLEYSFLLLDLL